jgi:hypothetical protein
LSTNSLPGTNTAHPVPPAALAPAACQFLRDGEQELCALSATLVSMAVKGYLTIEEVELGQFMLQRTWREGDLQLDASEKAVAQALYTLRPSRFFIMARNAGLILDALKALQAQTDKSMIRAAQSTSLRARLAGLLACGGVGVAALLLAHAVLAACLGILAVFLGAFLLDHAAMGKRYAQLEGFFAAQPWRQKLYQARGWIGGVQLGAGVLILLLSAGWLSTALITSLVGAIGALRLCYLTPTRLLGRLRMQLARYEAYLASGESLLAEPTPEHFQQGLPYALALGHEHVWAQRFDAYQKAYMGWRPRWLASPRQELAPSALAALLGIGLTAALLQALQTMLKGDVVADGDGPEIYRQREGM